MTARAAVQAPELRAALLLEVAMAPGSEADLRQRLGPDGRQGCPAVHGALRSLERDGLVVVRAEARRPGTRYYRLSAAGADRIRQFAGLLDACLRHSAGGAQPAPERSRP
jgi:DNA-binding PadR family transcriptional regulator